MSLLLLLMDGFNYRWEHLFVFLFTLLSLVSIFSMSNFLSVCVFCIQSVIIVKISFYKRNTQTHTWSYECYLLKENFCINHTPSTPSYCIKEPTITIIFCRQKIYFKLLFSWQQKQNQNSFKSKCHFSNWRDIVRNPFCHDDAPGLTRSICLSHSWQWV